MWTPVFLLISLSNALVTNGRLMEKSTKQTVTEVIPRRVNRQVFDEYEESQEYNSESTEEQHKPKGRSPLTEIQIKALKRRPRSSNELTKPEKRNTTTTTTMKQPAITKKLLIKKPIPKFNELESYNDFQSKVMLSPVRTDNMEHEDEDFNVDDYEFDAAHDEFSGQGKPLVPRQFKRPLKVEVAADKLASVKSDDKTEKKTDTEALTVSQVKKVKKSTNLNLGIINIPEPASKDSKSNTMKFQKIEKGYNDGGKKDLVGLASREGVYDFVFYKK